MKIGVSTKIFDFHSWIRGAHETDFDTIEINNRTNNIPFYPEWIKKVKPMLKKFDLSLHTKTCDIFTSNNQFTKTEIETIKSEILVAKMIGAKELVFHLKTTKLSKEEEDIFEEVVKLAKENDIDLLYESNRTDSAELCLSVLNRFPEINYTLDLGHMNIAAKTGDLGMSIDEFISKIKDRVVYIHAHNNKGKWDEHTALSEGNLDWKHVLDSLDLSKVKKIIIECNKKEEALKCREDLYKYLNRKL